MNTSTFGSPAAYRSAVLRYAACWPVVLRRRRHGGRVGRGELIAGFLGLDKLCLIYDDNRITIEGSTGLAFGEDVGLRYEAYGFHVQRLDDGWTTNDLRAALDARTPRRRGRR